MRFKNFKSKFLAFVVSGANLICAQNNAGAIQDIKDFMKVQKSILREGRTEFSSLLAMLSELCYHAELKNISQDQLIGEIEELTQRLGNTNLSFVVLDSVASSGDEDKIKSVKKLGKELSSNVIPGPTFELCKAILQEDNCDEIAHLLIASDPGQLAAVNFVTDVILGRLLEIYRPGYVRDRILSQPLQAQGEVQYKLKMILQIHHLKRYADRINMSIGELMRKSFDAICNFNQCKDDASLLDIFSTKTMAFIETIYHEAMKEDCTNEVELIERLSGIENIDEQLPMLSGFDLTEMTKLALVLGMSVAGASLVKKPSVA